MSLNKSEKEAVVADVAAQAARAQTLALAEYRGLTVEHLNKLRREARDKGVYLHVLKNTLARRAVAGTPFECAAQNMIGPLIYGFSDDPVAAAKVLSDFAKGNDRLIVKAGAHGGKALDAAGVKSLAAIPSKEVLLAQLLGLMQSPISRFARVLAALAEQRGGGAAAADDGAPAADEAATVATAEAAPAAADAVPAPVDAVPGDAAPAPADAAPAPAPVPQADATPAAA